MSLIHLFTPNLLLKALNHVTTVYLYILVISLVSDLISANSCCFEIRAKYHCILTLHPVFGYWQR